MVVAYNQDLFEPISFQNHLNLEYQTRREDCFVIIALIVRDIFPATNPEVYRLSLHVTR